MKMTTCVLSALLLAVTLTIQEVNGAQHYLYHTDPDDPTNHENIRDVSPILEYVLPMKEDDESKSDFEYRCLHPDFLSSDFHRQRMVEFYAPWCGHCIHFKPEFIQYARKVNAIKHIPFHAVSCVVHKEICSSQDVQGYPTVKWFEANEEKGEVLDVRKFDADKLLEEKLGVNENEIESKVFDNGVRKTGGGHLIHSIEKLQALNDLYFNKNMDWDTKEDSHALEEKIGMDADAEISFDKTMREGVFMTLEPLSEEKKVTLKKFLDLIQKTMPTTMKELKGVAATMSANIDEVAQSEEGLKKHLGETKEEIWSSHCSRDKVGKGYTCGVWELLHVITIGLPQWNIVAHDRIPTTDAAEILRDFVENFFPCNECRTNFIGKYDACAFQRCERMHMDTTNKAVGDWKELAMWLWELHNDVNVRIMTEIRLSNGQPIPGYHDEMRARWPQEEDCDKCWLHGGEWHEEAVYRYLRKHYWPEADLKDNDITGKLNVTEPVPIPEEVEEKRKSHHIPAFKIDLSGMEEKLRKEGAAEVEHQMKADGREEEWNEMVAKAKANREKLEAKRAAANGEEAPEETADNTEESEESEKAPEVTKVEETAKAAEVVKPETVKKIEESPEKPAAVTSTTVDESKIIEKAKPDSVLRTATTTAGTGADKTEKVEPEIPDTKIPKVWVVAGAVVLFLYYRKRKMMINNRKNPYKKHSLL